MKRGLLVAVSTLIAYMTVKWLIEKAIHHAEMLNREELDELNHRAEKTMKLYTTDMIDEIFEYSGYDNS